MKVDRRKLELAMARACITGESSMTLGSADAPASPDRSTRVKEAAIPALPYVAGGLGMAAIVVLAVLLLRSRRQVRLLQEPEDDTGNEMEDEEK